MASLADIAYQAERDLNSYQKKQGVGQQSVSATESGVNEHVERDFPGADVRYGEKANFGGSHSKIVPIEEGGDFDARGRMAKAKDFEGSGGPKDKMKIIQERRPGDDGVPVQRTNY